MHESMTFVNGKLNSASYQFNFRCFPPLDPEALRTTKCRYIHTFFYYCTYTNLVSWRGKKVVKAKADKHQPL